MIGNKVTRILQGVQLAWRAIRALGVEVDEDATIDEMWEYISKININGKILTPRVNLRLTLGAGKFLRVAHRVILDSPVDVVEGINLRRRSPGYRVMAEFRARINLPTHVVSNVMFGRPYSLLDPPFEGHGEVAQVGKDIVKTKVAIKLQRIPYIEGDY